jgi:hypothetical protein
MRGRVAAPIGLLVWLVACGSQPIEWWTGAVHGTLYGAFGVTNSSEGPPTSACNGTPTPAQEDPAAWWASLGTNITGGADAVGTTMWSNELAGCSRALQRIFHSVFVYDLTNLYTKASSPSALAGLIASADIMFNVALSEPAINPLGWPCNGYIGGLGQISTLRPGFTVTAGLTNVGNLAGAVDPTNPTFPQTGTGLVDLNNISGPGTRGRSVTSDSGPNMRIVTVDVKDVLLGAINTNQQSLAFTIASVNDIAITPSSDVQFRCRTFVQPQRLSVKHY